MQNYSHAHVLHVQLNKVEKVLLSFCWDTHQGVLTPTTVLLELLSGLEVLESWGHQFLFVYFSQLQAAAG